MASDKFLSILLPCGIVFSILCAAALVWVYVCDTSTGADKIRVWCSFMAIAGVTFSAVRQRRKQARK